MLNDKQHKVVYELSGNTIVSASPGSGKTKTLVARAQHKLNTLPPHKSLALITYTNAGADEIAFRLSESESEIFVGTIHRFCLEYILRPFSWIYDWRKPKVVSYDELMEFIVLNPDIILGNNPLDELNKIKKSISGELDLSVGWSNPQALEYVAELYYRFLYTKKVIDFNEILYRSYKIISENEFVGISIANKFYEISIDEFQDTNIFQYEIMKVINQNNICTFFLVGDERQRIFRFAGAIVDAFSKAATDFSSSVEILDITYRSTSNIINAYSSLFDDHPLLINESEYKNEDSPFHLIQTTKDNHNSTIINIVDKLVNEYNFQTKDIAILSPQWMDALNVSRSLRNKYSVVGLGALPHKNINNSTFNLLRCLCRFYHLASVRNLRIIRRSIELHLLENNISINDTDFNSTTNTLISRFNSMDKSVSLVDGIILSKNLFDSTFRITHSVFNEILNILNPDESTYWTFEKYIETLSGVLGITINTIHQAKGLEYDVVILNQINENKIPYQQYLGRNGNEYLYAPLTEQNYEDGRNLFYVGLSRAKSLLIVLHNWKPSIFISIIKP